MTAIGRDEEPTRGRGMNDHEIDRPRLRRDFLRQSVGGLGSIALGQFLAKSANASSSADSPSSSPGPKAKSVICLFQHGGPSQMDLFDPKPELTKRHGQAHPGKLEVHFDKQAGKLLGSPFRFHPRGQSGMELSEILPRTASIADDITLVRSMVTESVDHEAALRCIHSGKTFPGRPAWGSWVVYALGSEREELPAYVVLSDPGGLPVDGTNNWSSGFLPASLQGTPIRLDTTPVAHLHPPEGTSSAAISAQRRFLRSINTGHLQRHPGNDELIARIRQHELAAMMQTSTPELMDLSGETAATRKLYGLDDPVTANYGQRCLLARRLVERGVRFVQVFLSGQPWDTHANNAAKLRELCAMTDGPSAALVQDLKQRGLLDSTIVLWTGEFGRLPIAQSGDGRDHNRHGFSLWLAGAGFRRGYVHGATDDFGYQSIKDVVRVSDLHATLLAALGLDHTELSFPHEGRDDTLTDAPVTDAKVVKALFA